MVAGLEPHGSVHTCIHIEYSIQSWSMIRLFVSIHYTHMSVIVHVHVLSRAYGFQRWVWAYL